MASMACMSWPAESEVIIANCYQATFGRRSCVRASRSRDTGLMSGLPRTVSSCVQTAEAGTGQSSPGPGQTSGRSEGRQSSSRPGRARPPSPPLPRSSVGARKQQEGEIRTRLGKGPLGSVMQRQWARMPHRAVLVRALTSRVGVASQPILAGLTAIRASQSRRDQTCQTSPGAAERRGRPPLPAPPLEHPAQADRRLSQAGQSRRAVEATAACLYSYQPSCVEHVSGACCQDWVAADSPRRICVQGSEPLRRESTPCATRGPK